MYRWEDRVSERQKRLSCTHRDRSINLCKPLSSSLWSGRNVSSYIISRLLSQILVVTSLSVCHLYITLEEPSSIPPTQCTRLHFLLVCHSYNICMPRTSVSCLLLVTGAFSVTFVPCVRHLQLHRQMSKGVFKPISNIMWKKRNGHFGFGFPHDRPLLIGQRTSQSVYWICFH